MSQPRIMTVLKDETLVAFGTMNGIVYAIAKANKCDLYGTSLLAAQHHWLPLTYTYTLDDALYRLDNVTGRLANLNL